MVSVRQFDVAVAILGLLASSSAIGSQQIATNMGCFACHHIENKMVGPSFRQIAAKYRGRSDAIEFLSNRVRKGGPGSWGPTPMVPTDVTKLSDADLKAVLVWILKT